MKNLVDYSSSDSNSENDEKKQEVQQRKPVKLPMLLDTAAQSSQKNDPSEHQNRIRAIPHIEGNWASHVHIECKLSH